MNSFLIHYFNIMIRIGIYVCRLNYLHYYFTVNLFKTGLQFYLRRRDMTCFSVSRADKLLKLYHLLTDLERCEII